MMHFRECTIYDKKLLRNDPNFMRKHDKKMFVRVICQSSAFNGVKYSLLAYAMQNDLFVRKQY